MSRDCLRFAPLLSARPGELPAPDETALEAHLGACAECRARLADLQAVDGLIARALLDEANRVDFAPFADEVMARIERRGVRRLLGWPGRHRIAAALAGLVPALAALGLIVYLSGPGPEVVPQEGEAEVVSENRSPVVLSTEDGPVVLLGDPSEGS